MIFEDPTGARWKMIRAVTLALLLPAALLLGLFALGIFTAPTLPSISSSPFDCSADSAVVAWSQQDIAATKLPDNKSIETLPALLGRRLVRTAFVAQDDPRSVAQGWQEDLNKFKELRQKYLIYK